MPPRLQTHFLAASARVTGRTATLEFRCPVMHFVLRWTLYAIDAIGFSNGLLYRREQ